MAAQETEHGQAFPYIPFGWFGLVWLSKNVPSNKGAQNYISKLYFFTATTCKDGATE